MVGQPVHVTTSECAQIQRGQPVFGVNQPGSGRNASHIAVGAVDDRQVVKSLVWPSPVEVSRDGLQNGRYVTGLDVVVELPG